MQNQYVAIIPARGGSKGLPRKNVLPLAGKPLIAHTIEAAINSNCFIDVVVSTDCAEIKKISIEWGAQVIDRPVELATDSASSLDVITHTLRYLKDNGQLASHFILLQPTSPLRTEDHIIESISEYEKNASNTLVSIVECQDSPLKTLYVDSDGKMMPVRSWSDLTSARQLLPKTFKPNGAIYIANSQSFISTQVLLSDETCFYSMGVTESIDIDLKLDLDKVEVICKNE